LHGTYGEDGQVQQQLEAYSVPYTGSGPQASRLAFDKVLAKQRFLAAGVPTARFVVLELPTAPWPNGWAPPVVLKPVCQGSSVGLQFVRDPDDFPEALSEAFRFDRRVLLEEFIEGREMTVAILDGQALPIIEVRPKRGGAYDYHNKYTAGATEYLCPAPVSPKMSARIQATALAAFGAIEGQDYGRVDLIVRPKDGLTVLEVNTLPGMTKTSLFPKAARVAGIVYPELCERMVDLALRRAGRPGIGDKRD